MMKGLVVFEPFIEVTDGLVLDVNVVLELLDIE